MAVRKYEQVGAVVLGGAHGSLAVIRSLGRQGIPVWHLTERYFVSRFSRFTSRSRAWSGPADPASLELLLGQAEEAGLAGWIIVPGGDAEARFVAENHQALSERYRLITQPWAAISPLYDKHLMYAEARRLDISTPQSYDAADLLRGDTASVRFPLVIKPSTRETSNALTRAKAWRVNDAAELAVRLRQAVAMVGTEGVVVQELIPGGGTQQYSYAAVWNAGAPVASLLARRTRQFPVDFGFTSTFVETVDDPGIRLQAERLLASARYHGLVEIEFKHDLRDQSFKKFSISIRACGHGSDLASGRGSISPT